MLIDPRIGWWKEVDINGEEDVKRILGAEELERPALRLGKEYYGCWCDADAREGPHGPDCVVMRIKKGLSRRWRYFGYVSGPVLIHLNKGLEDVDFEFLKGRIFTHDDSDRTPFLLVDDFQNVVYEDTDP